MTRTNTPTATPTLTSTPNTPPGAFNKTGPADGATNQPISLTLTWGSSTGVSNYQYCIDTIDDNTCNATWNNAGTNTSMNINHLTTATNYYWHVRAANVNGVTYSDGAENAWRSFTTRGPGSGIVLNSNDAGAGSLRQVIADAGNGDTITFDPGLAGQTISLDSQLVVDKNLVIDGASLSSHVKISPLNSRGFYINSGVTATLRDLDIINGSTTDSGGGIYNAGTLAVENCTIAANSARSSGGGIYNTGNLTVSASTVSGNAATGNTGESGSSGGGTGSKGEDGRGGGIFNSGVLELTNVTLEGNQAKGGQGGDGGSSNGARGSTGSTGSMGYFAYCPQNQSCRGGTGSPGGMGGRGGDGGIGGSGGMGGDGLGGGIYNSGNITMVNVTLMNNQVFSGSGGAGGSALAGPGGYGGHGGAGGGCTCSEYPCSCSTGQQGSQGSPGFPGSPGIWGSDGSTGATISGGVYNTGILNLKNTILATSLSGVDCYNASGTLAVLIRNLIESNGAGANACGSPAVTVNPILGPLANNGGLTQTMALLPGSPAIDAGDNATCARTDQRGVVRPQGVACDIGAFELEDITSNARIYLPLVIR